MRNHASALLVLAVSCSTPPDPKRAGSDDTSISGVDSGPSPDSSPSEGESETDQPEARLWYPDDDGDGYGGATADPVSVADQPEGYVGSSDDCDDANAEIHPGADERCDEVDEDCDGTVDEDAVDAPTWHPDADGDGYGDLHVDLSACTAPDGALADGTDCDDSSADNHPGVDETCGDDIDNDCDGEVDEVPDGYDDWRYPDLDSDRYGDDDEPVAACTAPDDYISTGGDCDDTDPDIHPEFPYEYCDGVDHDCDGLLGSDDPDSHSTWYEDDDGDGYGDTRVYVRSCDAPTGTVAEKGDCDDADPEVSPAATEVCGDDVDEDCDGVATSCGFWGEHTADEVGVEYWAEDAQVLGYQVASAGDVDGDGLADLWIGAPASDEGCTTCGAMWLIPGGTDGGVIDDASSAVVVGDAFSEVMGMGMVDAGDVDGDGTEDVWTSSAYVMDGAETVGSASLFLGPFSGSRSKADEDLEWLGIDDFDMAGFSLAAGADLDGDGAQDMVMAAIRRPAGIDPAGPWEMGEVYVQYLDDKWGVRNLASADVLVDGEEPFDQLGRSLAMGGDGTGDGAQDLLIASTHNDDASGAVYVLSDVLDFGIYDVADVTQKIVGKDGLGEGLAWLGDLDGDGTDDFAASASGDSTLADDAGAIYVFYGPADALDSHADATTTILGDVEDGALTHVGGGQDFDGDGTLDLVLGADDASSGSDKWGRVYLLRGPLADGSVSVAEADAMAWGTEDDASMGFSVAMVGDTDGDGYADILAGAPGTGDATYGEYGAAWLILGQPYE